MTDDFSVYDAGDLIGLEHVRALDTINKNRLIEFTPEYIANCRRAKGGPWVFQDTRQALDEIERSHALIERLVEAHMMITDASDWWDGEATEKWDAVVAEYRAMKESVE